MNDTLIHCLWHSKDSLVCMAPYAYEPMWVYFLTVVMIAAQTATETYRYQIISFLTLSAVMLSVFALWGELSGVKYFLLLLLPAYFVAGASLFYFLLPVRWLTRLPFAVIFGISVYLLMLTSNIYNVAAIRTIALLRAAHAVGLLFSLLSTYFLANVLFSLHLPSYLVVLGIAVIVLPLYTVGLWSYELEEFVSKKVAKYAAIFTLVTCEVALGLAFWPVVPTAGALAMATIMYALLGLAQFNFEEKLKPRTIFEHLGIATFVFLIIIATTRWGG